MNFGSTSSLGVDQFTALNILHGKVAMMNLCATRLLWSSPVAICNSSIRIEVLNHYLFLVASQKHI